MNTAVIRMTSCLDCPHHKVERDYTNGDSFSVDEKTMCYHPNFGKNGLEVSGMNSVFETRKYSNVPNWCPILEK